MSINTHVSTSSLLSNGAKLDWKAMGMGAVVEGTIMAVTTEQCNKYRAAHQRSQPAVPDFWDEPHNTQPKLQIVITLQTALRDPSVPGDDGSRRIYVKLWGNDKQALRDACLSLPPTPAGGMADVPIGGYMRVQWISGAGGNEDPRKFAFWLWPASNQTGAALATPEVAAPQGYPQPTPQMGYAAPPTPAQPVDPYAPVARDQPVPPAAQYGTAYSAAGQTQFPVPASAQPPMAAPPAQPMQPGYAQQHPAPPAPALAPPAGGPGPLPGQHAQTLPPQAPTAPVVSYAPDAGGPPPAQAPGVAPAGTPAGAYAPAPPAPAAAAPPAAPAPAPSTPPGVVTPGISPEQLAIFQQAAAAAGQPVA